MEYLWRLKIATLDFPFLPKIFVVVEHHCELNNCLHQDTIVDLKFSGATESTDITPLLHDIWQSHYYQIILENVLGFAVSAEISQSYRMKNHFVPLAKLLPLVFLPATCFGDESLSIFLIFHYEDSVDVCLSIAKIIELCRSRRASFWRNWKYKIKVVSINLQRVSLHLHELPDPRIVPKEMYHSLKGTKFMNKLLQLPRLK